MNHTKNRRSWVQVIRDGVPDFTVMKQLLWNGALLEVGQPFPKGETHDARLRQLYASHRITPVVAVASVEPKPVTKKPRGKKNG